MPFPFVSKGKKIIRQPIKIKILEETCKAIYKSLSIKKPEIIGAIAPATLPIEEVNPKPIVLKAVG
jgi:hypothetical protein